MNRIDPMKKTARSTCARQSNGTSTGQLTGSKVMAEDITIADDMVYT